MEQQQYRGDDDDDQNGDIHRAMSMKKEQFSNAARKQYRDQIFRKKRLQAQQNTVVETQFSIANDGARNGITNSNNNSMMGTAEMPSETSLESILTTESIELNLQHMKSQDIPRVRQALQFFQLAVYKSTLTTKDDQSVIRVLVDANMIFELIDLIQSTKDHAGNYLLPEDIAANALYVLAIIASGDETFRSSILNKNGLTVFKDYVIRMPVNAPHPALYASAFLGLVNLSCLDLKSIRQHLKSIGMLEHLNRSLSAVMSSEYANTPEYQQMISNGVWLTSVLCYDPPENEVEMNQLLSCMPFLIACMNSSNTKMMKDVIWIIHTCLNQITSISLSSSSSLGTNHSSSIVQHLLNLGLAQALNRTVKVNNSKVRAQSFRCLTKLMKVNKDHGVAGIYQTEQIGYVLSVLRCKLMHNQYYALNYLNELAYQHRFSEYVAVDDIMKQLIVIVQRSANEKFTQLILQSVLKIVEHGGDNDSLKNLFESGMLSVLDTTLEYSNDSPSNSSPQNIILSLQILSTAFQRAQGIPVFLARLHRLQLEQRLMELQYHPLENISKLNLFILENFYELEDEEEECNM